MRQRYRLYRRKNGGRYYIHDDVTGKQDSLHTTDRATALRLFHSRGEAQQQPAVNLQIARAYLAASDPQIATRDWQFVMEEMVKLKKGETQHRWQTAIKDKAFDLIRHLPVLETRPENFLRVLETGKVSTNVYLRRIHNFALDMTLMHFQPLAKPFAFVTGIIEKLRFKRMLLQTVFCENFFSPVSDIDIRIGGSGLHG